MNGRLNLIVMTQHTQGPAIRFDATLSTIDTSTVIRLPDAASKQLPSRGQVAVNGTINDVEFQTVIAVMDALRTTPAGDTLFENIQFGVPR